MLDVDRRAVRGGEIAVLTLDRPPVNAMDSALLDALIGALEEIRASDAAGVLLRAEGRVFSAGADLREPSDDGGLARMVLFTRVYEALTTFPVPTAAAVEGPAVGGGAELVAACDLRVLADDASLKFPGASMGIPVGTARLVGLVTLGVAKDWVLSGRTVTPDEAARVHFASRRTAPGGADDVAMAWLDATSAHDRDTVVQLKRLANEAAGVPGRLQQENHLLRAAAAGGGTRYSASGTTD